MNLKKLLKVHKEELKIWVEFCGFQLELIYTDRRGLEQMLERSRVRYFDRKIRQTIETLSDETFNEQLAAKINDWKDLNLGKLAELTNINIEGEDPDQIIPCTKENKTAMVQEVYGLNNFIRETIMDLQAFRDSQLEEETKNSETSQESA